MHMQMLYKLVFPNIQKFLIMPKILLCIYCLGQAILQSDGEMEIKGLEEMELAAMMPFTALHCTVLHCTALQWSKSDLSYVLNNTHRVTTKSVLLCIT